MKKILSCILTLALVLFLMPTALAAGTQTEVRSANIHLNDYGTSSGPIKSYLYKNGSGLTRVEMNDVFISGELDCVVIEDYDSSFQLLNQRMIEPELPRWGGFFAGEKYNFLIFGQTNEEEDDNKEVIRVVKYDKEWNRLDHVSIRGADTTVPFTGGSLRCDEYEGYLYIHTAHEKYAIGGLNHQGNLTFVVRQSDMTISDASWDMSTYYPGYVTHSFNQFVLVSEEGKLVTLDHGDGWRRSVVMIGPNANTAAGQLLANTGEEDWHVELQKFPGESGQNETGASVGGLAETSSGYVAAYNYDGGKISSWNKGDRMIYLHYVDKKTKADTRYQLSEIPGTTPMIASTGLEGGYVLWNGGEGLGRLNDTLYYVSYDAEGVPGPVRTAKAPLSDCQPIPFDGGVVWYVTNYNPHDPNSDPNPIFYVLDENGVTAHSPGTKLEQPEQTFSDVPPDAWYADAVQTVYEKGLFLGTGDKTFSPEANMSYAQFLTVLSRFCGDLIAMGGEKWYDGYVSWAIGKDLIPAEILTNFDPEAPITRQDMAAIIGNFLEEYNPDYKKLTEAKSAYADASSISGYALDGVNACFQAGIMRGGDNNNFSPRATATRAQVAVTIVRLAQVMDW